jgi:hypothetical protein
LDNRKHEFMWVKKTILIIIYLYLAGLIYAQETPEIPTSTTAIESYDMPGYFLVCTTSTGTAQLVQAGKETIQGKWNIVTGLAGGTGTISFMPAALTDHYMRHRSYIFHCDPAALNDSIFRNDASFIPEPGLADSTCVSFRSVNYPAMYLQHNTNNPVGLELATVTPGNEGRATFKFPEEIVDSPVPDDGSIDIPLEGVILYWPIIPEAQSYVLYFGTSLEDVEAATLSDPCGTLIGYEIKNNSYALDTLVKKQTYYWRVDAIINGIQDILRGQVWSFNTSAFQILEDFESYTDDMDAEEAIWQTWIDGWGNPYNGSLVGYMVSPFAEHNIVYKGKQSMPLWYDNISGFAWINMPWQDFWDWLIQLGYEEPEQIVSESTRYFDEPMDWIGEDSEYHYLVLYIRGDKGNTGGELYAKINDAIIRNPDPNIVTKSSWNQWVIDFNELNTDLTKVKNLTIGIEGSYQGIIYVDEITLYENLPNSVKPQDPGSKNLAAWYTMDNNVLDYSAAGLDAQTSGNPIYMPGIKGIALSLDGTDDYVTLPIGNVIAQSQDMTIGCWIQFSNQGGAWQRIFDFGSGTSINMFLTPRTGTSGPMRFAIRTATVSEQQLTAPETLPSDWHHISVIIRGSSGTMYMYLDGQKIAEGNTVLAPMNLGITTKNWLGRSQYPADAYFNGLLDDFRIYTRSLTELEILYLAEGK